MVWFKGDGKGGVRKVEFCKMGFMLFGFEIS